MEVIMGKNAINRINTGGGTYIGGNVNTGGGKFVGRDDNSLSSEYIDVENLFRELYVRISELANLRPDDKSHLQQEIEELRRELSKNDQADENFLMRRIRNIGRMSPEILEVTLEIIKNPITGFGLVAQKIAERAKTTATQ